MVLPDQGFGIDIRDRRIRRCLCALLQPDGKPEGAARARRAVSADFSSHQFGQASRNRQAEAGAAILACHRVVGLLEGAEEPGHGLRRDADAGIADLEA